VLLDEKDDAATPLLADVAMENEKTEVDEVPQSVDGS
jgi:hypothetical protein